MTRPCCSTTCCPGGAKGGGAILAVLAVLAILAVAAHLAALAIAAGVLAACGLIAVAGVVVLARFTVRPPAWVTLGAPREVQAVTATVVPQAVQAERVRELPVSAPAAIENHWHLHLDGQSVAHLAALINGREPAPVIRAIPGLREEAGP